MSQFASGLSTTLFLTKLLQKVYEKYTRAPNTSLTPDERAQLFVELAALLGEELLARALHLIDEWNLVFYYTQDRRRSIAEFSNKRNQAKVVRVLPGLNYCKCRYFSHCVLQLKESSSPNDWSAQCANSYTCEHVLALRLHQLLQLPADELTLTPKEFNYFHCDIYET